MIEADNASTSIYQVLRMSRAAMTHLLIIRRSSIWPRMAEDILREGCGKSKWKFKMAFAMKGGGVSRGSRVPFTYFEK